MNTHTQPQWKTQLQKSLKQFEKVTEKYLYEKAPALPDDVKAVIVLVLPWLVLFLAASSVLTLVGLTGLAVPFSFITIINAKPYGGFVAMYWIVLLIRAGLQAMAFPKLLHNQIGGWQLLVYVCFLTIIHSIVILNLSGVLLAVITLYTLFQIKHYYS